MLGGCSAQTLVKIYKIKDSDYFLQGSELVFNDIVRPAPIVRRPFESLGNPYPQGCSKLCNHPINSALRKEYKEVIRRSKDSQVRFKPEFSVNHFGVKC